MNTQTYTVTGMTCGHCVNAIQEEVGALAGVDTVTVDLDSGSLVVVSEAPLTLETVAAAVDEAGDYTVTPA